MFSPLPLIPFHNIVSAVEKKYFLLFSRRILVRRGAERPCVCYEVKRRKPLMRLMAL